MTRVIALKRRWFFVSVLGLLVACSPPLRQAPPSASPLAATRGAPLAAHDAEGRTVAAHLQERYDDTSAACQKYVGDPNPLPAVLCSGILMRATVRGNYDVWDPNPGSRNTRGTSFSWLRRDSGFSRLAYGYTSGFIILPRFFADAPSDGYTQLSVLCIYPFDADTNNRTGGNNDGCAAHSARNDSGPCQAQGIQAASQWLARFVARADTYANQCGFTLTQGTANAYSAFQAQAAIRASRSQLNFTLHNEVMIATWAQHDKRLPIEAFYYTAPSDLAAAKLNQGDFRAFSGRWIPVIRVTLPTVPNGSATFTYSASDQEEP